MRAAPLDLLAGLPAVTSSHMRSDFRRWITILAFASAGFGTASPLCGQQDQFHIEANKVRRVKGNLVARMTYRPVNPNELRWCLLIADAPELDRQSDVRTYGIRVAELPEAKAELLRDTTPNPRSFYRIAISAGPAGGLKTAQGLTVSVTYEATLYARRLVRGASKTSPAQLTEPERKAYLEPGNSVNIRDPSFQAWLDRAGLRRRDGETDLAFAFRAFKYVREHVPETGAPGVKASEVCASRNGSSCGGCAVLFCAILRTNGIPARSVWGRPASSRRRPDQIMWHVKAEFYAAGIGWVPADPGAGRGRQIPPEALFGRDGGDFITFHIDPDIQLPDGFGGTVNVLAAQSIQTLWQRSGGMNGWKWVDHWTVASTAERKK
jgi:transglutaminase-like putative cysteine protease